MSTESDCYRLAIRTGVLAAEKDRAKWERAVSLIYELEREEEALLHNNWVREKEAMWHSDVVWGASASIDASGAVSPQFEKCLMGAIAKAFTIPAHLLGAGPRL